MTCVLSGCSIYGRIFVYSAILLSSSVLYSAVPVEHYSNENTLYCTVLACVESVRCSKFHRCGACLAFKLENEAIECKRHIILLRTVLYIKDHCTVQYTSTIALDQNIITLASELSDHW